MNIKATPPATAIVSGPSVTCPYCECPAGMVTGKVVYPHRPDLHDKLFYMCAPCFAWCGVHEGTTKPLGRLADAELRHAKQRVHAVLDPLWLNTKKRGKARGRCYAKLAMALGISVDDCHVGMFDVTTCNRAVSIITSWRGQC